MTNLSHEARVVVEAGKDVFQPTNVDRLRVTQALAERMGAASLGIAANAHAASSLVSGHSLTTLLKIFGAVGLAAVGGGYYQASRKEPALLPPQVAVAVQPSSAAPEPLRAPSPVTIPEAVEPTASVQSVRLEQSPRSSRSRGDSLREEVAILTQAGKELHNGKPAAALKTLDEHQRKFPSGMLTQERSATRIQALCALGRTSEAAAESAKLARTSLGSPQSLSERPCASR